jgi:hypothetical protein
MAEVGRYAKLYIATPMHRSQLGIDIRIEVAERRAGLPADCPPLTILDIVFGGHAEQRSWLNARSSSGPSVAPSRESCGYVQRTSPLARQANES